MKATDVFKSLNGYLWETISRITPEEFLEPVDEISVTETILGPMNDLEKAIFTIQEDLFESMLVLFELDKETPEKVYDFYLWVWDSSKKEFAFKCWEQNNIDQVLALEMRSQLFAAYDFMELITTQRFALAPEDALIFYRKGFLVTMQKTKLFLVNDN